MVFSFKIIVFIYYRKKKSYRAMIVIDLFESIDCIANLKELFNDLFVAIFIKHAFLDWKLKLNWFLVPVLQKLKIR